MAPRKVAETFCQEKQAQFGISNEQLEVGCTSSVEAFIVNELIERGVVDKGPADEPAAEPLAHTAVAEETTSAPVQTVVEPIEFVPVTADDAATAVGVSEDESHKQVVDAVPVFVATEAVDPAVITPPADIREVQSEVTH